MFDISFAELMLVGLVGLLVIGPDKLPQVARTAGAFIGRLQRYVAKVKEEVNRDERFKDLQNLQQEIKQGVDQVESSMMAGADEVKGALATAEKSLKPKRKTTSKGSAPKAKPASKKSATKKTTAKSPATKKAKPKKPKGQA